jgi:hypothetical protein
MNEEVVRYLILRLGGSKQLVKQHSNMNEGSHIGGYMQSFFQGLSIISLFTSPAATSDVKNVTRGSSLKMRLASGCHHRI